MKHKLTNLQRLGISALLLHIRDTSNDKSMEKGGLIHLLNMENCTNIVFCGYNDKRITITVELDENLDDTYEYRVRYDSENNMYRIIDLVDGKDVTA